ncbi:MAG: DUF2804 domain-containing protein [Polyangiaceae bacterium]
MSRWSTTEAELLAPVDLTLPDGTLNPGAIGFSRRPLHRCSLPGPRLSRKRWDYWCVTTERAALCITYADLGYLGLVETSWLELEPPYRVASAPFVLPGAVGMRQPDTVSGGDITFRAPHLSLAIREHPNRTELSVAAWTVRGRIAAEVSVERSAGEESLNVVIPWSRSRFQFTSKQIGLPAKGHIRGFGRELVFEDGYAHLDYGRGRWPRETVWNWGGGAGRCRGENGTHRVGLQLGGKWTDGTGLTENGIFVDGKLHKSGATLIWDYDRRDFGAAWRVRDPDGAIDLRLEPELLRPSRVELGVAHSRLHVAFGRWFGRIAVGGHHLEVDGIRGWAEEHDARW